MPRSITKYLTKISTRELYIRIKKQLYIKFNISSENFSLISRKLITNNFIFIFIET